LKPRWSSPTDLNETYNDKNHDKLFSQLSSSCAESNLNGVYRTEPLGEDSRNYKGIFWEHWLGDYSLKASKMMIRPKEVWFSEPSDDDLIELRNETITQ
jgi:hypothetical protein